MNTEQIKYNPEIFNTDTWKVPRFDDFDYFKKMKKLREEGKV